MTKKTIPTPEELRKLLRYEPETGKLFWLPRPEDMFATHLAFVMWNKRFPGKEALTAVSHGYKNGRVNYGFYMAHRVIWAMEMGEWPRNEIDHINGNRMDNRIVNLRAATHSENQMNRGPQKNSNSGVKGVFYHSLSRKWQAQIKINGVQQHIGLFETIEGAAEAYRTAAEKLHGEFARIAWE